MFSYLLFGITDTFPLENSGKLHLVMMLIGVLGSNK